MGTQYLATSRVVRNPVRVQQWNASLRAGDDFKLALTVFADDDGTPAQVLGSRSQLLLWPDDRRPGFGWSCDYGLGWLTGGSVIAGPVGLPAVVTAGTTPDLGVAGDLPGRLNFYLPGSTTAGLRFGRYRLSLQVDLPDGEYSQVEGILQVREPWCGPGLGHLPQVYFTLDGSYLDGPDGLAPAINSAGLPVDADGFLLAAELLVGALLLDGGVVYASGVPPGWPLGSDGLAPGAFYLVPNCVSVTGYAVGIVPGLTPGPGAQPLFYSVTGAAALLAAGGGDLPQSPPAIARQLWNDGGLLCALA